MSALLQDLRYALRRLRNGPGFAAMAIATTALIKGPRDSVPIAEITTVAKRGMSLGKTLGLVFGVLIGVQVTHDVAEVVTGNYIM